MGRREGVKQKKRKTNQAYPPAWKFQAVASLICSSPWFVVALLESHSNHNHTAWKMLLIGAALALLNFLGNFHSGNIETALTLFLISLIFCFLLFPVFKKAREKAARNHSHHASTYHVPRASGRAGLYDFT